MSVKQLLFIIMSLCIFACSSDTKSIDNDSLISTWILEENCISPGGPDLICNPPDEATSLTFFEDGQYELVRSNIRCNGTYDRNETENELSLTSTDNHCNFSTDHFLITELNESTLTLSWIGCIEPCISHFKKL